MGKITLNLKVRQVDYEYSKSDRATITRFGRQTKKYMALVKNHIGIKTARKLIQSFKGSNLCPQIERVSFSRAIITY